MVHAGRMETVQQTVAIHGAQLVILELFTSGLSFAPADAAAAAAVTVAAIAAVWPVWCILLLGDCSGELGNLVRHGLDLCGHSIRHHLCAVVDVGGLFFLGNCCLGNPGNLLPQFIAAVGLGCLICTFKAVLADHATVLMSDL